jgi:Na+-translocating membrane potential-generating system (MpsC)
MSACLVGRRPAADTSEVIMKSQGEIEAQIGEGIARFEQEYMGRRPKESTRTWSATSSWSASAAS